VHRVEHLMGMPVSVDVRGDADLDPVFDWLRWVDATFSTYRDDSEIARLARGERLAAHPLVEQVLARCDALRDETAGYFDARASGALDPSGLVKGWAVEEAAKLIPHDAYVNAGGDVRVNGRWRLGVQHPRERDRVAAVIAVADAGVATSGAYERGEHVLDPHTGRPPDGVLSVTIVGPDLGTADAYATAAFAMGRAGPDWTATLDGYEAMTILSDGTVLSTPGFEHLRIP
jgi:thiamine biosynthesis lipoprotein